MTDSQDAIFISLNDRPIAVVRAMDGIVNRSHEYEAFAARWRWLAPTLLMAGFVFLALDLILGFGSSLFIFAAAGTWIGAFVAWRALRRARPRTQFGPHFQATREVVHTLRDDVHPRRTLFGHLDLTGWGQKSKIAREAPDRLGRKVVYYRDEWLSLKTKLYDGNMLRVSAIERVKQRAGYYKRGRISGKQKWKPPVMKGDRQELKVRVSVNPDVYTIVPDSPTRAGARIGAYAIDHLDTSGGIITLSATSPMSRISPDDILGVLRATYAVLQRKV